MKTCSKCKIEKDESEFYKKKAAKDGITTICKTCYKCYFKTRNQTDERKAYLREYFKKYRETDNGKNIIAKAKSIFRENGNQKKYSLNYTKSEKYKMYRKSEKYKLYMSEYRKSEKGKNILTNCGSAIKSYLGLKGIPTTQIPPELLELKKLQLQIKRELKNGVQNENKN